MNPLRRLWDYLAYSFTGWSTSRVSETPGVLFARQESSAGVEVTEETALSLSAVFAGVNLLSRVLASLPLHVYRQDGRKKDVASTHPAYRLLHTQPNPEMTSVSFRRAMEWNRLLWGGAYAEVQWSGSGQPAALWPIEGWRVCPDRDQQHRLYYKVKGEYGEPERKVMPEDMLAVPHCAADGVYGRGVVSYAIQSLGLAIGTQEFAARYFGNGATPGGYLVHPGNPSPEARREMSRAWNEFHQGAGNAHKTAVIFGGWEHKPGAGHDAERAQLLEQRRFTNEEVARWLNVPPHLLRDLSRATFSNIEHQGLDFVTYSLNPTLVEYEQEFDRKLLSPPDLFCKHNVGALLRGDSAAQSAFMREMVHIGVYSVNDCLELLDLNPVEGGDVHFFPMNLAPLPDVASGKAMEAKEQPQGEGANAPQPKKAALASDHWKDQPRDGEGQWAEDDEDEDEDEIEDRREREDSEHTDRTEEEEKELDRRQDRELREIGRRWREEDRAWARQRKIDKQQDDRWADEDEAVADRRRLEDDGIHAARFDEDAEDRRRAEEGEPEREHPLERAERRRLEDHDLARQRRAEDRRRKESRAEERRARESRRAERNQLLARREQEDGERQRRHLGERREMYARWAREDREMRDRWAREDAARQSGLSAPPPDPAPGMRRLLTCTLARMARVEGNALRRAAEQPGKFLDGVERLYAKHQNTLTEAAAPVLVACHDAGVRVQAHAEALASVWCVQSRAELLDLAGGVTAAGLPAAVAQYLEDLEGARPARVAAALIGGDA